MRTRWLNSRIRRQVSVWAVPAVYILAALLLGRFMPRLDSIFFIDRSFFGPSAAIGLLTAIATGMIAFTGFVFSLAFLLVQFGSSAYSPRLTDYFLRDGIVRHSLGMFIATFSYALIALSVLNIGENETISNFTILGALLSVLGSVIMFLALIQHITTLQVTHVLYMVGDRGRQIIERLYPDRLAPAEEGADTAASRPKDDPAPEYEDLWSQLPPVSQEVIYRGSPLVVHEIDTRRLVSLAFSAGAVIEVRYSIGDVVPDGTALLRVHGGVRRISEWRLSRAIELGTQRTIEQDPKYAIRLIVDIAIRALSTGINDPTTAVQALDQLDDLLHRIGNRQLDVGYAYDRAGQLRIIYPTPSWEDFLDMSLDEIRYYGADSLQVMRRLRALLEDLEDAVPVERRDLIRHHLDRVEASIQRSFVDIRDRVDARQPDRQGIGLSRNSE